MTGRYWLSIVTFTIFVLLGCNCAVFAQEGPSAIDVLGHYGSSLSWLQSVSMQVRIDTVPKGYPEKGPYVVEFVFRHDGGRAEWTGRIFGYDEDKSVDPNNNHTINEVITSDRYLSYSNIVGRPIIVALIAENYEDNLQMFLQGTGYGGPLWGRIFGNGRKNIPELLSEAADLHLRGQQETVNGVSCYVLEGTCRYGHITAWVTEEKGYSALKWSIEKNSNEQFDIEMEPLNLWNATFEVQQIERIGDFFIATKGCLNNKSNFKDGREYSSCEAYTVSDIELNPDFDALGAFEISLPNGTRVQVRESPGIHYVWQDGQIVPDLDTPTFEQIDAMVQEIQSGNN